MVVGVSGEETLEAWLDRLDASRDRVLQLLADTYGEDRAEAWYHRWRVFDIACSELFATNGGTEWHVTHTRMRRRRCEPPRPDQVGGFGRSIASFARGGGPRDACADVRGGRRGGAATRSPRGSRGV